MTTKQYLGQIERLNRMIENKVIEVGQIRSMACNISAPIDKERVQSSSSYDKIGEKVARLVDLENETDELIKSFVEKRKHIISQIDSIDRKEYYLVLTYRYVQFMDFKEIFLKMGISERNMYYYYGQALKEFEKKFGSEYLEN